MESSATSIGSSLSVLIFFNDIFSYPTALELVATKRLDLSGLTRAHYTLEETLEAFKRTQKADVVKVFITC